LSRPLAKALRVLIFAALLFSVPAVGETGGGEIAINFTAPPKGYPHLQLNKLPASERVTLREVADNYTLYMEAEKTLSAGDPQLYEYLFDRLALSSVLLRELKLARYNIYEESHQSYRWIDPKGVFGRFRLVYKEPGKRIYYGSGFYDGRLMPRVEGRVIMIFRYGPVGNPDTKLMQNEVYSYIEVKNILYSAVARILRPILPVVVKGRMNKLFTATKTLSEWITKDPEGVYRRLESSSRVSSRQLTEFKRMFVDHK
jgi:hypothetical protein